MDMEKEGEGEMYGESNMETYIIMYKIHSQWEFAICLRELKQGLCIKIEGWELEGHGREVQEGGDIYIYLWLIHVDAWHKTTKSYNAIIPQTKDKSIKKKHTSNVEQLSKKTNWKIAERFLNQGSKKDHRE